MPLLRPLSLLALLVGLLAPSPGCGPDPRRVAAQQYADAMSGTLGENAALSRRSLEIAEQVRAKKLDEAGAAQLLESEILPRARALESQARAVAPTTPALQQAHLQIVEAWSVRADAYADLARAWQSADLAAFDKAMAQDRTANEDAADGLEDVNAELSRYGLSVDPFPAPAATAKTP